VLSLGSSELCRAKTRPVQAAVPSAGPSIPTSLHGVESQRQSPVPLSSGVQGAHSAPGNSDESLYLKKNIEHLRLSKRQLEGQVESLEDRVLFLEQQNQQYKSLYEQSKSSLMSGDSGGMELSNLQQQLCAVQLLKDALNAENLELQQKLKAIQNAGKNEVKQNACVICMDNLANVVCLPCKHLSLCSFCCRQNEVTSCPICRSEISDKIQIFIP